MHLESLSLLDRYASNRNDLLGEFYSPCLSHSIRYDRAAGFFRSSVLLLIARSMAEFAMRGGHIRIVCSPDLTEDDLAAIRRGYELRKVVDEALQRAIEDAMLDPNGRPAVEFLATLIASNNLDIRVAFRASAIGIFHDKIGVFSDDSGSAVSFVGSINETFNGWSSDGNHESFDVFRSWTQEADRVAQHQQYFERLWDNSEPGIQTIRFPDAARERLVSIANPRGIRAAIEDNVHIWSLHLQSPAPHQVAAVESWELRGCRGILEHATGSGKTLTALTAIREWLREGRPAIVLVPSDLLLDQWIREAKRELQPVAARFLYVGAGHTGWRLPDIVEGFTDEREDPRLTIATIQTASSQSFRSRVRGGDHLLLVIDEVHRAGSHVYSSVFSIDAGARLGLSATPHRFGDPDGTQMILNYFNGIVPPPFTLSDAIAAGRLCRYTYYVHPTMLSDDEADEWQSLTLRIRKSLARKRRDDDQDPIVARALELLLIKRARILKRAASKLPLAVEVIRRVYARGQRWLVYCDDQDQLSAVADALRKEGFPTDEYHTAMAGDPAATLEYFETYGGILVAIRCLDEGVDIPGADHALILASSRNPREFIQRRGRVLRKAPGKYFAEIHDVLVLPPDRDNDDDIASILRGELARAVHFADGADNESVRFELRRLAWSMHVDPDGLVSSAGFETEGWDDDV